ncbi:MAG: RNA methyltransferase [Porticoccaceae bacterium]|nr:RNA methyltransferase [Porticoccaceae bacterium]MDG1474731.1 RNA methyltransferase [Porticoccaceae bacterium]
MESSKTTGQQLDSPDYLKKKAFFEQLVTVYGRKPVLEILENKSIDIFRLHLADSNRGGGIIEQIKTIATQRNIDIRHHSRHQLSRISRNSKQDQGVACDIHCPGYLPYEKALTTLKKGKRKILIALDGVTNPQNLGMIIRSVTASPCYGLLLPVKGVSDISPLVIKASAGTLFKGTILRCSNLIDSLKTLRNQGFTICMLSSHNATPLIDMPQDKSIVYVLGNETTGVSDEVADLCDRRVGIPMNNGVESLNVAVAAALVAFNGA